MASLSPVADLAAIHQRSRIKLAQAATLQALGMFRTANLDALDASWDVIAPPMTAAVVSAQRLATQQAAPFLNQVETVQGGSPDTAAINPAAFAGTTIDGREVGPAMFGSITTTKSFIGNGMDAARAFEVGASFLATVVQSAIADAGRQADRVLATGKNYTHYVRVVQAGACSRCAILAGTSSYKTAFLRHPNCHCTAAPMPYDEPFGKVPRGLFASPDDYFESLTKQEQDRVFTNAGAQAIRDGANPVSVVNARRGAAKAPGHGLVAKKFGMNAPLGYDANGNAIKVFTTGEGTTIRGAFGKAEYQRSQETLTKGEGDRYRRTTNYRLMPESIYALARGDQARAIELLKFYKYID